MRPIYRTGTPLPSKNPILYIFSTNIRTEFFKHAAHTPFFPLQNTVYFIMLPFWFLYYSHFTYRMCQNLNSKFWCQRVNILIPVHKINGQINLGWTVRESNPSWDDISSTCPDRTWGPSNLLTISTASRFRGKAAGVWRCPPTPSSSKVKERVD
jgi:hypothetical protein